MRYTAPRLLTTMMQLKESATWWSSRQIIPLPSQPFQHDEIVLDNRDCL
jgi:hypothetical protein